MNLKKFLMLIFYSCGCSAYVFGGEQDKEIYESFKCSKNFSHFEKKHQIPTDTLHSISLRESGKAHTTHRIRVVWPWSVGVEGEGHYFTNKQEAVTFVKKQLKLGKTNIDVGCMQINLKSHPEAFLSIEHAFEPRINVAYGAKFLRDKYDDLKDWHKAIAHYHSSTPELGFKYKQEVIKIADKMPEYKINLKKYTDQICNGSQYFSNAYAENNNSLLATKNYSKNVKVASTAKVNSRNYSRWRSNMMVPIPKYQ